MKKNAIIDTSVLICLHHLDLLQNLNLFFSKVFVPREVEKEFLAKHKKKLVQSNRYEFLENFYQKHSIWFEKCQAYNSDIVKIYSVYEKNIFLIQNCVINSLSRPQRFLKPLRSHKASSYITLILN